MLKARCCYLVLTCFAGMLFAPDAFSQKYIDDSADSVAHIRNVLFTTPVSKNTTINGLALGLQVAQLPLQIFNMPQTGNHKHDSLKINGVSIDLSPFAMFFYVLPVWGTFLPSADSSSHKIKDPYRGPLYFPDSIGKPIIIKGVAVSGGGLVFRAIVSGVSINGAISLANQMHGLEISGMANLHYSFKGLMIAGLRNKVAKGSGVQIGLVNNCKEGRVFQIGLWNRIGNRAFPFINFSLRRRS